MGDIIVFSHPVYGKLIKLLDSFDEHGDLVVIGKHPESTDSRVFGPIPRRWVIGKVIGHIRRPDRS